jgi:copper chaperone CopZ
MDRRHFIQRVTAATATGVAVGAPTALAQESKSVTFKVKGFTCITCAVGLEVVLREQKGVTKAKASYREQRVTVGFDAAMTTEDQLKAFINKTTGFTVAEDSKS